MTKAYKKSRRHWHFCHKWINHSVSLTIDQIKTKHIHCMVITRNRSLIYFNFSEASAFSVAILRNCIAHCRLMTSCGWRHWSEILAQEMARSWRHQNHCMDQCWLIIKGVLWHTQSNFTQSAYKFSPKPLFVRYTFKITFKIIQRGAVMKSKYIHHKFFYPIIQTPTTRQHNGFDRKIILS